MTKATRCKTLLIHIGDHKTGSTSVQYAFAQKAVRLPDARLCYPSKMAHNYLSGLLRQWENPQKAQKQQAARNKLSRLARKIRKSGADYALLSAEALEGVDPALLQKVVTEHFSDIADHIRIIAYVRPHAPRLLSSYATQTKSGLFGGDLDSFHRDQLDKQRLLYHPRFTAWRAVFGDAFILRPFLRERLYHGDIVRDLLFHGFDEPDAQIAPVDQANESLTLPDLLRLKYLQAQLKAPHSLHHALGWEVMRQIGRLEPVQHDEKLTLHRSLATGIRDSYRHDAEAMDQTFFADQPLFMEDLDRVLNQARTAAQPTAPEAYFDTDELRSLTLTSQISHSLLMEESGRWGSFLRRLRLSKLGTAPKTQGRRKERKAAAGRIKIRS